MPKAGLRESRSRIDMLLVERGLVESRQQAQAILLAGDIRVDGAVVTKPGVMAGAVFAFILSFDQFPVSLFLVSPGRETLPITLFNYLKFDLDGTIGAASVVSILLAVLVVFGLDRTVGLRSYAKL